MNNRKIKIGIPKALLYYKYQTLWTTFFKELGCTIIESPNTNNQILEEGKKIAVDETCLSLKIYLGHIDYLKDKCDQIVVPRIVSLKRGEQLCTNFSSLYDIVKNSFDGINLIEYNVDVEKRKYQLFGFLKMGKQLNKKGIESFIAYQKAKRKFKKQQMQRLETEANKLEKRGMKILIVSHPYNTYDNCVGQNVTSILEELDVTVIHADCFQHKNITSLAESISPNLYWTYNKELVGAIKYCEDYIDGIITLSTFPCGPDSLVNELISKHFGSIPCANIIIDELNENAGLQTRIESFVDILKERRKKYGRKNH